MRRDELERSREALARRALVAVPRPSLDDVYARAAQRRRRRAITGACAAALVIALGVWAASGGIAWSPPPSGDAAVAGVTGEPVMRFADGTRVWALDATPSAGCCHLEEASGERVVVRLEEGAARFEVTPDRARDFVVLAGGVTVRVLGTGFEVTRRGSEVEVNVLHGVVSVAHAGAPSAEPVRLERGERAAFVSAAPPAEAEPAEAEPTEPEVAPEESEPEGVTPAPVERPRDEATRPKRKPRRDGAWKSRARAGDYDAAAELLAGQVDLGDVEELFLAADAMRLTNNPREALGYLDRIIDEHPKDRRAPMAAITKGRIVHGALGDACEAAEAFARATALGARGSLGRDALIREAESWRECGEEERARGALERFIAEHPGHRERAERLLQGAP